MSEEQNNYLLWGAKGHAKVLNEIVRLNEGRVIALIDNNPAVESPINDVLVYAGYEGYRKWLKIIDSNLLSTVHAIAAIGGDSGKDRFDYYNLFKADGLKTPSLTHPRAHVSDSAYISDNCHICAYGFVGPDSQLGEATIINTKASVDHECHIGKGVHLAPGVTLCGCVKVGDFTFIGAGATVLPNLSIGKNVVVGAGSLVVHDIPDDVVVYGCPAKLIRKK